MAAIQLETDRDYKAWRDKNPEGFIANVTKKLRKSYFVIHRVDCTLIRPGSSRSNIPGAFTERGYSKAAGTTLAEVINWGHRHEFPFESMRSCQRCLKGARLPFPEAERRFRPFDRTLRPKRFVQGTQYASREETFALKEKAAHGHHALLVTLHDALRAAGWTDLEEMPTAIDLRARNPGHRCRVIFEAKTLGNELHQTRAAFAQLEEYRLLHGAPEDHLCLVVDAPISEARMDILAALGISILWLDGEVFCGSSKPSRAWMNTLVNQGC